MQTKHIKDKEFDLFISASQIQERIMTVASKINEDYAATQPLFICVLNGAFMFASDLIKKMDFFPEISFVKVSSYSGLHTTGAVKNLIGLNEDINGRDIILIEDIIDSGLTMKYLLDELKERDAKSIRMATLLFKPDAFKGNYPVDYIGFEIPNEFVVGYGMDYDGFGRNLPDIYHLKS
ncbi:MAG: hypoxanthine phosphoribosyltransferase [Cyclobacteriaceae bacterium]